MIRKLATIGRLNDNRVEGKFVGFVGKAIQ